MVGEIDGISPLKGLFIQCAPPLHSGRHQRLPLSASSLPGLLTVDRVVKIAGIFAINGDQRQVSQINPTTCICHLIWYFIGFRSTSSDHWWGIPVAWILQSHPGSRWSPVHLTDNATGGTVAGGWFHYIHQDNLASFCTSEPVGGNNNILLIRGLSGRTKRRCSQK